MEDGLKHVITRVVLGKAFIIFGLSLNGVRVEKPSVDVYCIDGNREMQIRSRVSSSISKTITKMLITSEKHNRRDSQYQLHS